MARLFSNYQRYHDAGEAANANSAARFGQPAHSLFTSSKVFTLHKRITVTDAQEQPVYEA